MYSGRLHYANGQAIHARDRVRYKGISGSVVFVTDGDEGEFVPGYEDYHGHDPGFMFCDDDGDLTFLAEADQEVEFVSR
jgi:hypothetical protein